MQQRMKSFFMKKKLRVSEGTRFLYCFIFLILSIELRIQIGKEKCGIDILVFSEILSGIMFAWGVYILFSSLPKFRETKFNVFFRFLDHFFGIVTVGMFVAGTILYFNTHNDCFKKAKLLDYFLKNYLVINGILILAMGARLFVQMLKRCRTLSYEEEVELNMSRPSLPYIP